VPEAFRSDDATGLEQPLSAVSHDQALASVPAERRQALKNL